MAKINTIFLNNDKFPGNPQTIGGRVSCHWEAGLTPLEINRLNASKFYVNSNEISCAWGHKLSHLPHSWLKNQHVLNPLYILHKVPFVKTPNKLGGSLWDLNPYFNKLSLKEQDRVKRLAFYDGMFLDDGNNQNSNVRAFSCYIRRSYEGKPVYVFIPENSLSNPSHENPLIPTFSPQPNLQTSNGNWITEFITEFINWFFS